MKINITPFSRRHCAGASADERGSAIILVLVSLVLMVVLAGSLLQLTRFERIPRSESNIEVVIASVIDEIINQLTEDVLDDNGNYLNTGNLATGGGDEPFDFPWTNPANFGKTAEYNDGTTVAVFGGVMDDSWLASHAPDFGPAPAAATVYNPGGTDPVNGVWRKITNLTGLYLGGTGGNANLSDPSGPNSPIEYPVNNFAVGQNRDQNLNTTANLLVDADGDGIGDSRWEWAPLRQVGATQYVMAVRIIDLSARMDANVAIGSTISSGAPALSTEDPRGDGPTELDGSAFVGFVADADASLPLATAQTEWRNVLDFRLGDTTPAGVTTVMPYDNNNANPTPGTRRDYWTDGASRVSNTFGRNGETPGGGYNHDSTAAFGLVDAFELLQGNGVNSANTTTIEDLMPNFLRRGPQEDTFAISGTVNGWNKRQFWELDPRKHISMFTGSAISARPVGLAQNRELKIDVNEAVKTAAGRDALRNRINAVLSTNDPGWSTAYPHFANPGELADQLTANIVDYIDDDNQLTVVGTATGFEALPYIAEVYTQRHYESAAPTTVGEVLWNADGAQGYVIEIGNPFAPDTSGTGRPVSLDNIWLDMNGTTTPLRGGSIAGVPAELAPGEVLLLYQDSGGPAALAALQNYYSATGPNNSNTEGTFTTVHTAVGPVMAGTANQTIGLRAAPQGDTTNPLGWNYSACEIELGGPTVSAASSAGIAGGPGVFAYIQTTYSGHGVGLRMMTVTKGGGSNDYSANTASLQDPSINCDIVGGTNSATRTIASTLANESKSSPAGFASLGNQQIVWPDSERQRMHWIGDILQIPLIGPKALSASGDEMAQAFVEAAGVGTPPTLTNGMNALLLPYKAGAPVVDNAATLYGVYNVPHALLLLEQLTTFNPATDGENGDGSTPAGAESIAVPNDDEVLVPGKLNLNTAPYDTLVRLLPFPDLGTRQNVANAIITRRESMQQSTAYGIGANNIPGIAYTSSLYEQIENLAVNPSRLAGDTTNLNGTRIDLNDYETALGTYVSADGVADDREEEIMLAKWLSEVADNRSDVFAAYIIVQGYPADNFTGGATESAKLIVIFSRAGVKGAGDRAVEIGRFRIN